MARTVVMMMARTVAVVVRTALVAGLVVLDVVERKNISSGGRWLLSLTSTLANHTTTRLGARSVLHLAREGVGNVLDGRVRSGGGKSSLGDLSGSSGGRSSFGHWLWNGGRAGSLEGRLLLLNDAVGIPDHSAVANGGSNENEGTHNKHAKMNKRYITLARHQATAKLMLYRISRWERGCYTWGWEAIVLAKVEDNLVIIAVIEAVLRIPKFSMA